MPDALRWTALRHQMLREIVSGDIKLEQVNYKRAIWKPMRWSRVGLRDALTAAESRALGDFGLTGSHWVHATQPNRRVTQLRRVDLTDAGLALLSEWDTAHPNMAPGSADA
jgi:hypothetical protein